MESNWRWNVWDFGFVGSDYIRLAARVRSGFPGVNRVITNTLTPGIYDVYIVVPGQVPIYTDTFFGSSDNFPYGVDVFPD